MSRGAGKGAAKVLPGGDPVTGGLIWLGAGAVAVLLHLVLLQQGLVAFGKGATPAGPGHLPTIEILALPMTIAGQQTAAAVAPVAETDALRPVEADKADAAPAPDRLAAGETSERVAGRAADPAPTAQAETVARAAPARETVAAQPVRPSAPAVVQPVVAATPVAANPVAAVPVSANPVPANPVGAQPVTASPVSEPVSARVVATTPIPAAPVSSPVPSVVSAPVTAAPVTAVSPRVVAAIPETPPETPGVRPVERVAPASPATPAVTDPATSPVVVASVVPSGPAAVAPVSVAPVAAVPVSAAPVSTAPVSTAPVAVPPAVSPPASSAPAASAPVAVTPVAPAPVPAPTPAPDPAPAVTPVAAAPSLPPVSGAAQPGIAAPGDRPPEAEAATQTYKTVLDVLAAYPAGPCFAALPSLSDTGSFQFETFARSADDLARFRTTLEVETGSLPNTTMKPISEAQCRTLAFVQDSPAYPAFQLYFDLANRSIASGEMLEGRIGNTSGGFISLLLIDDEGRVQNLGSFLKFTRGAALFRIPMTVQGAVVETQQLLLALSTPVSLQTVRDAAGQPAEAFFQDLGAELRAKGQKEDLALVAFSVR